MDPITNTTLTACPACGAASSFQWCGDVWAYGPVGNIEFDSVGTPTFEATAPMFSEFEQDSQDQNELLECSKCYARIATRQGGNANWSHGDDHGEHLPPEFEVVARGLVRAIDGANLEAVMALGERARELIALTGIPNREEVA